MSSDVYVEFADLKTHVMVCKTLIQPHFDYCSQIWGCHGVTLQNKLQRLQNRAVRIYYYIARL